MRSQSLLPAFFLMLAGVTLRGQTVSYTPLGSFNNVDNKYAEEPVYSEFLQAADGNFYGLVIATSQLIKVAPAGGLTVVADASTNITYAPSALVQGPDGNFYGMGEGGKSYGQIFKLTPAGDATSLYSFTDGSDGSNADASGNSLIVGSDGNLYGVVLFGGTVNSQCGGGCGVVFRISPSGAYKVVYSFTGGLDGAYPTPSLLQASDGNFYGVTRAGGSLCQNQNTPGCGTVFQLTPSGKLKTIYNFPSSGPASGLVEGSDGALYGVLADGDDSNTSSIYRIDFSGDYSTVVPNGSFRSSLFPGSDGAFYGNTASEAFRLAVDGTLQTYEPSEQTTHLFDLGVGISQGSDGNFYGLGDEGFEQPAVAYKLSVSPPYPAPVQVSLSSSSVVAPGSSVVASFKVLNAYSLTMQQCYAFSSVNGGPITPLGKVSGTFANNVYSGSVAFTPATGIYDLALTCGGIESGYATLSVGYPTATTLTASPTSVMPPNTVQLQATVKRTSASGTPGGSVTFSSGTDNLGTASLINGVQPRHRGWDVWRYGEIFGGRERYDVHFGSGERHGRVAGTHISRKQRGKGPSMSVAERVGHPHWLKLGEYENA